DADGGQPPSAGAAAPGSGAPRRHHAAGGAGPPATLPPQRPALRSTEVPRLAPDGLVTLGTPHGRPTPRPPPPPAASGRRPRRLRRTGLPSHVHGRRGRGGRRHQAGALPALRLQA